MNINRHNYETFFLLYVDNELSDSERKSVELFVQENPDLGEELVLLLDTTLPDETISFSGKKVLYKNETDQDILKENLLLYLDNELDPVASKKIEALIGSDNNVGKEWKILQQTKLDPKEEIVFENKDVLYRHEKGRVVAIRFWRMAAAAAILLACLFAGITMFKKNTTGEDKIAKATEKPSIEKQKLNKNSESTNHSFDSSGNIKPENIIPENIASTDDNKNDDKSNIVTPDVIVKQTTTTDHNKITSVERSINKAENSLPVNSLKNSNKESNKLIASTVLHKNNEVVLKNTAPEIATVDKSVKEKIKAPSAPIIDYNSVTAIPDNSFAKTAVLNETTQNDDKIFYMSEETVSRSKVGGLFRKVKRLVERNTSIKTANGIRIAGFEIAVK